MKCPRCGQTAISLVGWCVDGAFGTDCQHCDAELKCNRVTVWGFWLTVLVSIGIYIVLAETVEGFMDLSRLLRLAAMAPFVVSGGLLTYVVGGYKIDESRARSDQ